MKINHKKGILIPEVLKMIVALACILLLLYLGFSLYGILGKKTEVEQARAHLDTIERIILDLEKEGGGSQDYVLLTPKDWVLTSWPKDLTTSNGEVIAKPDICKYGNCICFCYETQSYGSYKRQYIDIGNPEGIIKLQGNFLQQLSNDCDISGLCIDSKNNQDILIGEEGFVEVGTGINMGITLQNNQINIYPKKE